jgi:hypothetical protein
VIKVVAAEQDHRRGARADEVARHAKYEIALKPIVLAAS